MSKGKKRFSPFWKQCFVTIAVCSDVLSNGSVIGYSAILLPQLEGPDSAVPLSKSDASWVASLLGMAMFFGVASMPPLMGRLGRKVAHYVVLLVLMLAWILFAMATSTTELVIARILQGLSIGMFSPLRAILIGEYTSPKYRGGFLSALSLAQGSGILLIHYLGSVLSWQRSALISVFFPFLSLIMTMYSPESPSWLAARGRYDECRKAFRWLRGDEEQELQEMIHAQMTAQKPVNISTGEQIIRLLKIATKKEFCKPIIVMLHVYCMLSVSGCIILACYTTTVISLVAGPNADPDFWMITFDVARIFISIAAIYIMNRVKRRNFIFFTLGLSIISHMSISAYVYAKIHGFINQSVWLPITLLTLQYFTVGFGIVPLAIALAGELFPLAYRSLGAGISAIFYGLFMFLVLKTFIGLVDRLGIHGAYLVYAGILSYILFVMWYLLPETKGKTLQQIENEYKGVSSAFFDTEAKEALQPSQTSV